MRVVVALIIILQIFIGYLSLANNAHLEQVNEMVCQIGHKTAAFGCFID